MLTLWPHQAPALVIGHRGAMGYAPENTLLSFEEAIRRGADLIELDVQLTADGEVIVMHDTSVDRTTDGTGFVRDLPANRIQSFDAGAWYGPDYAGQYVPSLAQVIERFRGRKTTHGQLAGLIVELKTVRGSGGSLADAVVALLAREDFVERCFIISFDAVALQEVRSAHKTLPIGLLFSEETEEGRPDSSLSRTVRAAPAPEGWPGRIAQAKAIGAQAIFPRKTWVTSRGVASAHKADLSVGTWTANTKNEMKRMITCGVDAIATNFPDRLRALMG
jgi:glycerophosphoryl diester phosphodiesterase